MFDDLLPQGSANGDAAVADLPQEDGAESSSAGSLFGQSSSSASLSSSGSTRAVPQVSGAFDDLIPGDRARLTFYTRYDDGPEYQDGRTAAPHPETGQSFGEEGVTVAVDPAQIPYGSRVSIPSLASYSKNGDGMFTAHDTGGAVRHRTASGGKLPVLDVYVDGQDKAQAQARRNALAESIGTAPLAYQVLPPDASNGVSASAPTGSVGMFSDLIPKQGQTAPPASQAAAQPRIAGSITASQPNTVVSVPDARFFNGQPFNSPKEPLGFFARAAGDALSGLSQAGGNIAVGLPRFIQSERAQYLSAQPKPLAPMTAEQMQARRQELESELADLREDESRGDDNVGRAPSLREQQIVADLAQLTPEAQALAKQNEQATKDAKDAADKLGEAQRSVEAGYDTPLKPGEQPPLDARIAKGLGNTVSALTPFGIGLTSIAAQASNSARDKAEAEAKARGETPDAIAEAGDAASNQALASTASALPAYAVAGSAAGRLAQGVTPQTAGALRRFVTQASAATGANVAAGTGVRAAERGLGLSDEPVAPTLEGVLSADLPFALSHAAHVTAEARNVPGVRLPQTAEAAAAESVTGKPATVEAAQAEPASSSATPPGGMFDDLISGDKPTDEQAPAAEQPSTGQPPPAASPEPAGIFDDLIPGKQTRTPVPPVFAFGDTPEQRAEAFLEPSGDDAPTAVRFAAGEAIPPELENSPRTQTPDGSTVVYDPELHSPEDFTSPAPASSAPPTPDVSSSSSADVSDPALPKLRAGERQGDLLSNQTEDLNLVGETEDRSAETRRRAEQQAALDRAEAEKQQASLFDPEDTEAPLPLDADLQAVEDQARREHEAELLAQGKEAIAQAGGVELLDALKDAGGLPTDDPTFRGELKGIREASQAAHSAGYKGTFNLFRKKAPSLDELAGRLRSRGFDVSTPGDVLGLVQDRVTSKKPVYGFAARAEAQSGMANAEGVLFRKAGGAAKPLPRTPEELLPEQRRWFAALKRLSPATALKLEVVRQQTLDALWSQGLPRANDGSPPQAAFLDNVVYLSAEALRRNPSRINRVNLLHEVAHGFERALPQEERDALREQWRQEMQSGESPLLDAEGNVLPEVDPRVKHNFSEWLAERLAWENQRHFASELDPAAAQSPIARLAAHLRRLVMQAWQAIAPKAAPSQLSARYRAWLGGASRSERAAAAAIPPESRLQPLERGQDYREVRAENANVAGPALFAIRAFHGTPHKVDKFSLEKIGTGEGAQVYGYGLYFAENHAVAESYRKGLTEKDFIAKVREAYGEHDGAEEAAEALKDVPLSAGQRKLLDALKADDWWGFDYPHQAVRAALHEAQHYDPSPETLAALQSFGNNYTVRLDAEPHELLDWDKPLSEQSPQVRESVRRVLEGLPPKDAARLPNRQSWLRSGEADGQMAYKTLQILLGESPRRASEALRAAGVPGIRYLDQGSRRAADVGTRNFVMFDDSRIQITHRNGKTVGLEEAADEQPQFARRRVKDTGTGDLFEQKPKPKAKEKEAPLDESAIRQAYRRLVDRDGWKDVQISDLAKESGVSPEKLGPWILEQARAGKAAPTRGDWSLSSPEVRAAAVQLRGEPHLQVRLNDAAQAAIRPTIQGIRNELASRNAKREIVEDKNAAETRAGMIGRQAGNSIRYDFPDPKDRAAMPFVVEAGGNVAELQSDLAKVKASHDPELAKKYVPVVQHAIANFARLDALKANYEAIAAKQRLIERRHGIDSGEVKNYVTRKLDLPENQRNLEPVLLGGNPGGGSGGSRYFTRGRDFAKLADAIEAGYPPKSSDLADLLEHRVGNGQRLVQERKLFSKLKVTPAPGDPLKRPILGQLEAHQSLNGKTVLRPPLGYDTVQTGTGTPLIVHRQYSGLFKALYGDSAIRNSTPGRLLLKYAGLAKHGTLVFDTFHVGRVIAKELSYGYQAGYEKGLSLLEYSDKDLSRAVTAGDITQAQADYARAHRPAAEELIKAGLNVGKVADNLMEQSHSLIEKLPGAGPLLTKFNGWVFGKLSRGAMLQTALTNYARNLSRFPELSREQAARRTAREMNEVFGNLQSQGLFKSRTMQDLARLVFLAPQWTESQLRAEGRGIGQVARIPLDAARGKFRVGVVAQGMVSNVIALLAANQVANYLSRGKPTWQNPEEDHKLDAWIPGGKRGFFFNPLEIAAENLHQVERYYHQQDSLAGAVQRLGGNKLSPLARGAVEAVTGQDYSGRRFLNGVDRARAVATDALPFPLPGTSLLEKDPRGAAGGGAVKDVRSAIDKTLSPLGYRVNRQPGAVERQLIQSAGLKVTPAESARTRMYAIAKAYRKQDAGGASGNPSVYPELRRALDNDDMAAAADELRWLVSKQGKNVRQIGEAMGVRKGGGIAPERFTGSEKGDREMLKHLSAEQRGVYEEALRDHAANARKFQRLAVQMAGELNNARAVAGR